MANRDAARFYHDYLKGPGDARVRGYLAQRQVAPRTATRFGLGTAPKQWDVLTRALTAKGYSKTELIDAGLAVAGKNGGVYDKLRVRLILPVIDVRGEVAGFTSRIPPGEEGVRYLNTSETIVLKKGRLIYALNFVKSAKRPNPVLVEGSTDVITLHQAGFDNMVATMGIVLTEERARTLACYTKELVLCCDNDAAGKQSTNRVLNILKNANLNVRVFQFPNVYDVEGKPIKQDPDGPAKKFGPAVFEKCLSGNMGQNDYRLETLQQKHSLVDEEGYMIFLKEAVETVTTFQSPIEREVYGNKAAVAVGTSAGVFAREVERSHKNRAWQARKKQARRELTPAAQLQPRERELRYENLRSARAEEEMVKLLLLEPDLFPQVEGPGLEQFSVSVLAKIYVLLCQRHREGRSTQLVALAGALFPEETSHLVSVMDQSEALTHSVQVLRDYIEITETEALRRGGMGASSPLLMVREEFRERKAYGG